MTLKEKLKKQLDTATPTLNRPFYQSEQCEKIADEFAIGFAKWYEFMLRQTDNLKERFTENELLEMYKKEKGL